jgi:general secretion pathway protein I
MNKAAPGFTLVEILVALTILAIAMGAYLHQFGFQAQQTLRLQSRTLAHWAAQNHLAEMQLARTWPAPGKQQMQVQQAGRTWLITQRTETTPNPNIRRVELQLSTSTGQPVAALVGYVGHADGNP